MCFYFQNLNGKVIVNHIGEHCYVDNVEPTYQNSWDMRSSSPAGSNRNSAASSDSGRGLSANYLDPKVKRPVNLSCQPSASLLTVLLGKI